MASYKNHETTVNPSKLMKYIEINLQRWLAFGSNDNMKTKMKNINSKTIEIKSVLKHATHFGI